MNTALESGRAHLCKTHKGVAASFLQLPQQNQKRGSPPVHLFAYNRSNAEKDILDRLHGARATGRFPASFLVGLRCHHSHPFRRMVGRLPKRLVLGGEEPVSVMAGFDSYESVRIRHRLP
jgi:hypothetical protein